MSTGTPKALQVSYRNPEGFGIMALVGDPAQLQATSLWRGRHMSEGVANQSTGRLGVQLWLESGGWKMGHSTPILAGL